MQRLALFGATYLAALSPSDAAGDGGRNTLCVEAPSLTVCADAPGPVDFDSAGALLESEFARLATESESAALEFALKSFAAADFKTQSGGYKELKDRALIAAYASPADPVESERIDSGNTGDRYFAFETIGHVAHRAGDKRGALEMVRERLPLVRELASDGGWSRQYADLVSSVSKAEAFERIASDAAEFGDLKLARSVLREASGGSKEGDFDYLSKLARVEKIAGALSDAESNARNALKNGPNEVCKNNSSYESKLIPVHLTLIESLARQRKSFADEVGKLQRDMTAFCTYLSGHASNFFSSPPIWLHSRQMPRANSSRRDGL